MLHILVTPIANNAFDRLDNWAVAFATPRLWVLAQENPTMTGSSSWELMANIDALGRFLLRLPWPPPRIKEQIRAKGELIDTIDTYARDILTIVSTGATAPTPTPVAWRIQKGTPNAR